MVDKSGVGHLRRGASAVHRFVDAVSVDCGSVRAQLCVGAFAPNIFFGLWDYVKRRSQRNNEIPGVITALFCRTPGLNMQSEVSLG